MSIQTVANPFDAIVVPDAIPGEAARRALPDMSFFFDNSLDYDERLARRDDIFRKLGHRSRTDNTGRTVWESPRTRNRFCDIGNSRLDYSGDGAIYEYIIREIAQGEFVIDFYHRGHNISLPIAPEHKIGERVMNRWIDDDGVVHQGVFRDWRQASDAAKEWLLVYCKAKAEAYAASPAGEAQRAKIAAHQATLAPAGDPVDAARLRANTLRGRIALVVKEGKQAPDEATRRRLLTDYAGLKAAYEAADADYRRLLAGDAPCTDDATVF